MKKILIVNNDFDTMSLIQTWLERKQYEVIYTGVRDEVEAIIREFQPDLLIIDIMQNSIVDELKENPQTREIPILVMTGYTISKGQADMVKADDFIEKPFQLDNLKAKIESLLLRSNVNPLR